MTYNPDYNTTLTTLPDVVCDQNNIALPNNTLNDITNVSANNFLPCIKLKENGEPTNLNDSIVNLLNNDDMLKTMALSKDSEGDETDDEKVANFKNDMCNIDTVTNPTPGDCVYDGAGGLVITQEAFLNYMSKDK